MTGTEVDILTWLTSQKFQLRLLMKVSNLGFLVDISKRFPARIFTRTVKRVVCARLPFDTTLAATSGCH